MRQVFSWRKNNGKNTFHITPEPMIIIFKGITSMGPHFLVDKKICIDVTTSKMLASIKLS